MNIINITPLKEKVKFQELAVIAIERDIKGLKSNNFQIVRDYLINSFIESIPYCSFYAAFTLYLHYNFPRLEIYSKHLTK